MKDVKSLIKNRLKKKQIDLLNSIAQIASRDNLNVYVAGGFVRDLLLNIQNFDLDLVVEGNGIKFAETLAIELKGLVKSHARFGTSVVTFEDNSRIDVAMARTEYYSYPGALPKVERSSIEKDLFRRDFTLNSMAIKLYGHGSFYLMDFFNSETDLKTGLIRVLHAKSFIEDPCRIFRAIRFEQRLKFCIEGQTKTLMKDAIDSNLIDQLSGKRLMNEINLILMESDPAGIINRMKEFSLLKFFTPDVTNDGFRWCVIKKIDSVLVWLETVSMPINPEIWFVYFLGLFVVDKDAAFEKSIERLCLPVRISKRMRKDRSHFFKARSSLNKGHGLKPSEIYDIFSELSSEVIILLLAACSEKLVANYVALYFDKYHVLAKTKLTNKDLIRMGIEPGPIFDDVFKALRYARLNGKVVSREEEIVLVRSQFLQ